MKQTEINKIYRNMHPTEIPWNIETPPKALVELVESEKVKSCKTIDLGCGAGNYAIYLASIGFDVTGVDISLTAIKIAKENAKKKGVKSDFLVADVLGDLDEVKETFDFAYDWELLHHIFPEKRKKYVENVYRILNPRGKYLSVCFSEKDPQFGGSGKYRETRLGTILYFSSEDELRDLFEPYFNIKELKTMEISGKSASHLANYVFMERKWKIHKRKVIRSPVKEANKLKEPFGKFIDAELGANVLFITCGLPGTWKTETSEEISKIKGYPILRTDLIRRELLKDEDVFDEKVASNMDKRMMVYDETFRRADEILDNGNSVILDATFITNQLRRRAAEIAAKHNKAFVILQTHCPQEVAIARILRRTKEDYESNALTEQAYLNNKKRFEEVDLDDLKRLNPDLNIIHLTVDTEHDTPEDWYIIGVKKR